MATSEEVLEFEARVFFLVIISQTENTVNFRINLKNEEEFQRWKELFMQKNNTSLNVKRVYPKTGSKVLHKKLICLHSAVRNTGKKKTYSGYVLNILHLICCCILNIY